MDIQSTMSSTNVTPTASGTLRPVEAGHRSSESAKNAPIDSASNDNKPEDIKSVHEAAKRLQDFVSGIRGDIQFSVDSDSGKTVVKVVDRGTQEVIRQFPSKEALEIAGALDRFQGLLVKQQA